MIYHGSERTPVREVVLHCAAIKTGQFDGMTAFQVFAIVNRWHKERGFKHGFGYHQIIMPDGGLYGGRPLSMIGAHVFGHNAGTVGVLLIESREITHIGEFSDWFTEAQRETLKGYLGWLRQEHGIERVTGHNDHAARLCPGFKVISKEWLSPFPRMGDNVVTLTRA